MSLARRAARAALAASFISGGIDQLRNPQAKAGPASPIAKPIADRVPQLPNDPESLVKLDGAIKVAGGLGLVFGPFARPAALLLAGSMVPTTLAGHRFWETTDPEQKVSDQVEFFKNISLVGGLLVTALDTGGRPSLPWLANKAAHGAAETVGTAASSVGSGVSGAGSALTGAATAVGGAVASGAGVVASGAGKVSRRSRKKSAKASKKAEALKAVAAAQAAKAAKAAARTTKETAKASRVRTKDTAKSSRASRVQARDAAKATKLQARDAAKASKVQARAAKVRRTDADVSARLNRAKDAALTASVAARGAAAQAGVAAKDALAAKERLAATATRP